MNKELLPNTILSHYRIVSKLGAGGMGEVWLAEDTRLDRKVALKLLPAEFTQDAERLRRFTQEAKAASALNHPNIISVYDIGECETGRFIVMELVSGHTLRSVIASDNSLDTFFALGHQMVRALGAAHAAGITHRDIKPDNIMVRDDGYVKILDFGLARLLPTTSSDPEAATLAQQTTPGTVMGTLAYMSPEQASGKTVGSASDVFALGIVLYELATGRHPFKSETMIGYLHAITSQMPPSMTSMKSHLPAALDDLILRMLEKEAKSRPTASEIAQALQEIEKYGTSNTLPLRIVADKEKATREAEGFWIAVLPFKYAGSSADLTALSEGLSEDIVTGLSRFSYLRVIARGSTLAYSNRTTDLRTVGKELGARYVMEGSLRQAGSMLRVTVQLVDATTGAHLWAETYERTFRVDEIFALQDELVPKIVSTAADRHGVLPHTMSEALRNRDVEDLRPYEVVLRGFGYFERVNAAEHAALRAALERAVEQAPTSDCWAMLALMYCDEHRFGFNPLPDSLGRALAAAQRAVEAAVSNSFANEAQAQSLFFLRELNSFRNAAARAVALNPLDGATTAFMGLLMAYAGDWEHGCSLAERAMQLNPHHPGWYWSAAFWNAYRKRDYRAALSIALKFNMPGLFYHHVNLAIVYGQLGERESASKALRDLLVLKPDFALSARYELGKWLDLELVEHAIDGLRKAGLEIRDEEPASTASAAPLATSETRADEGFWVAVLPFKFRDADPDVPALAEGLSEEISTGLSRFRYLSVVTSTSAVRLKGETEDERALGAKLGTRYVLEGSIRKGDSVIRVSAQLVDTETGAQLWSETYNRDLRTSTIFAVQDDVAERIVATVADSYGVLVHSMRAAIRKKDDADLTPVEWQFQYFAYREQITPSAHAALKRRLERVAKRNDRQSNLWACLAQIYVDEYAFGFEGDATSLDRALAAGRRAVELDRANQFALVALAQVHFFRRDLAAFGPAAERGMALNPLNTDALGILGLQIVHTGEFERGTAIVRRAMELNANHAGWMHFAPLWEHFHKGEYERALECANRVDVPGLFWPFLVMASACGHLGRRSEAEAAVKDLLALDPEFAAHVRSNVESWHFASGLLEPLLEGLRKAGLEIANEQPTSRLEVSEATSVSTTEPRNSIAVLPFTNLSANPENEYFCDGLAEELLNALAKIDRLKVAARTSTFSFKGKNAPVSEIAKALNVNTIMEGSVRKSGNRVRITAQVINAADGYHLWSERYDREMKDIFDVQDEITLAVVKALKVKLFGQEQAAVLKRHTRNPEAHEFYLRGLSYFVRFTPEFFQKAIKSFDQAIAIDPRYASAYAGLAECYTEMSFFAAPREWMPKAREAARQALEIDDTLGIAHNSLAVIKMYYDRDYAGAEHEFKHAIALDPGSAHIHNWYGWYLGLMGRFDESSKEMKRAQELDPLSDLIDFGVGAIFHWSRKPEQAIEHYQRVLELNPNFRVVYWFLADAYVEKGDFASAIATIENAPIALNDPVTLSAAAHAYGKAGERRKALEILSELERQSSQEYEPAFHIAQIYLGLGDHEQALAWLEKACDERSVWRIWLGVDPKFDPLRSDPRFEDLLRRVGLPHSFDNYR